MRLLDLRGVVRQMLPQAITDDLQLHRLDVQPQPFFGRAVRLLNADCAQVVNQRIRGHAGKRNSRLLRRRLHGLTCRLHAEQFQPEGRVQARRDRTQIGVESRRKLLAHGEQGGHIRLTQQIADLREEFGFGGAVGRVNRQNFLELVEDEDHSFLLLGGLRLMLNDTPPCPSQEGKQSGRCAA